MRHQDDRGVQRRQLSLEPLEAFHVEVVRGLVEQQQVGIAGKSARQRGPRELASREGGERAVEIGIPEPEPSQHRRGTVTPAPAAGVLEPCLRLAVAAHRCRVVCPRSHRLLQSLQLVLDAHEVGGARQGVLPERQLSVSRRPLVVQRDAGALLQRELSALQRRLADERP